MNSGNSGSLYSSSRTQAHTGSSSLTDAVVDTMVRWPIRMTGATMDFMLQGVQRMTGTSPRTGSVSSADSTTYESTSRTSNGGEKSSWGSMFSRANPLGIDQDLSGDDLKYVFWSIIFTKPDYECILHKQEEELVNYSADKNTYAALKIAQFLDGARHGHMDMPEPWSERGYPSDSSKKGASSRTDSTTVIRTPTSTTIASSSDATAKGRSPSQANYDKGTANHDKGWRIPQEDQKYICFLYRVDRRLPRQEEVTRVDRVTVERNTRVV